MVPTYGKHKTTGTSGSRKSRVANPAKFLYKVYDTNYYKLEIGKILSDRVFQVCAAKICLFSVTSLFSVVCYLFPCKRDHDADFTVCYAGWDGPLVDSTVLLEIWIYLKKW